MKKRLTVLFLTMVIFCMCVPHSFAETGIPVTVTIANGTLKLTQGEVMVTDADADGKVTISDALYLAHQTYDRNGVADYATEDGAYGLCITKLWGAGEGYGFGYYVNHKAAAGLAKPVKAGDVIDAFVYTDTAAFSDVYCYFNADTINVQAGEAVPLTLTAAAFDENWNPIEKPVAGANILIDGEKTEYVTDANGTVTLTLTENAVISAVSDTETIVPPVCCATVLTEAPKDNTTTNQTQENPNEPNESKTAVKTADTFALAAMLLGAAFLAMMAAVRSKKRNV